MTDVAVFRPSQRSRQQRLQDHLEIATESVANKPRPLQTELRPAPPTAATRVSPTKPRMQLKVAINAPFGALCGLREQISWRCRCDSDLPVRQHHETGVLGKCLGSALRQRL